MKEFGHEVKAKNHNRRKRKSTKKEPSVITIEDTISERERSREKRVFKVLTQDVPYEEKPVPAEVQIEVTRGLEEIIKEVNNDNTSYPTRSTPEGFSRTLNSLQDEMDRSELVSASRILNL